MLYALENFARRMVHQFPTNPTAQVCLGLVLRRRACHNGTRPVPQALRRQLEQVGGGWAARLERSAVVSTFQAVGLLSLELDLGLEKQRQHMQNRWLR